MKHQMLTTLDAKPQEWMQGNAALLHTVAACHFDSLAHAEKWINLLVPKNRNGDFIKWAGGRGGRRKEDTRTAFLAACIDHARDLDFSITCVSTTEAEMSWFAWSFYYPNRGFITQRIDAKGRNGLVFNLGNGASFDFPVLRAGYLIWYHRVIRYLCDYKGIGGKFVSDNFCCDAVGPGVDSARGVTFVNWLLSLRAPSPQVSLPRNDRFSRLDLLSDHFCGLANTVWSGAATENQTNDFNTLERLRPDFIENVKLAINLTVVDENGVDVTEQVQAAVALGSLDG